MRIWSGRQDLNLRPPTPHAGALPGCATPRITYYILKAIGFSARRKRNEQPECTKVYMRIASEFATQPKIQVRRVYLKKCGLGTVSSMQKKILRRTAPPSSLDSISSPVLQRIYAARGILKNDELERGLEHLLPWQSLSGISQAVACLYQALVQQEKVVVIGDFDADGATSSVLAVSALRAFGLQHVDYLIPNRFEYGYGLTPEIVAVAHQKNPNLIITVDNGISSCAGVDAAKVWGIKVLITDHHLPGAELPAADAIVNPNLREDPFPSKNLAGVGVIFYVMLAFRSYLREQNIAVPNMAQFLDLVALGTVADVVPLDRNNRILVYQGLKRIRAGQCRPGILALLTVANRRPEKMTASDLGFAVAPRLNAAGRLDDMSHGVACLLATEYTQALPLAHQLDVLNQERKGIEQEMQQQAWTALEKLHLDEQSPDFPVGLCLFDQRWHQGVIGILAGRLKDRFHRPVIAFASADNGEIKGSARSIAGIHIRDILDAIATAHPGLVTKFGGHAMAAGLSLPQAHYADFSKAFDLEMRRCVSPEMLNREIYTDGELSVEDICLEFVHKLNDAGPWGQTFPEPLFDGKFRILEQRLVGQKHLKLTLDRETSGEPIQAIAFNIDPQQWPNHRIECARLAYRLDINEFRGRQTIQFIVEYLEPVY